MDQSFLGVLLRGFCNRCIYSLCLLLLFNVLLFDKRFSPSLLFYWYLKIKDPTKCAINQPGWKYKGSTLLKILKFDRSNVNVQPQDWFIKVLIHILHVKFNQLMRKIGCCKNPSSLEGGKVFPHLALSDLSLTLLYLLERMNACQACYEKVCPLSYFVTSLGSNEWRIQ